MIQKILQEKYDEFVRTSEHEVVGMFLQGSQNYGLAYENSDIDCKVIVMPTMMELVLNLTPISTTLILDNDEHIDVKDIRLMFQCFKKQNINFLEILFTDYKVMNPVYQDLFQPMFDNAEMIAHYNNYASLSCMVGMMKEKFHALEHEYPSKIEVLKKFGYDPKQLHHILRLSEFIDRFFIKNESFKDCLISTAPEDLINIKRGFLPLDIARDTGKFLVDQASLFAEQYKEINKIIINNEVDTIMTKVLLDIFKRHMKNQ